MDEDAYVKMTFVEKLMLDNTKKELAERYKQLVERHDKLRKLAQRPAAYGLLSDQEKVDIDAAHEEGRLEFYNEDGAWVEKPGHNPWLNSIYRIAPEPEYIQGDEITDELLKGGRVPCEVRNRDYRPWVPAALVLVLREGISHPFLTEPVGVNADIHWQQCRIRKEDIPKGD